MSTKDYDWHTDQAEIPGEYWIHIFFMHMKNDLEENCHTPSQNKKAIAIVLPIESTHSSEW